MAGSTLTGGGFQDCLGNPIANGRLVLELSVASVDIATGLIQICPGAEVSFALDVHGNIAGTPSLWANNLITPSNTYYMARVYTEGGQLAWGPNAQFATGEAGGTINLTAWVPSNPVPAGIAGPGGGHVATSPVGPSI